MKPVTHPVIAMPPLAENDPVKTKPISIIEKKPETCHVNDLVNTLILLSMCGLSIWYAVFHPRYCAGAFVDIR